MAGLDAPWPVSCHHEPLLDRVRSPLHEILLRVVNVALLASALLSHEGADRQPGGWPMGRGGQVALFSALVVLVASAARSDDFQVVVHRTVDGTEIRRALLADIYKKDVIRWGNRVRIQPVDQSSETPVRQAFLRDVLGQSLGEVQSFWRRRMATDRVLPPPTKASDEEVLTFVASTKGAIGYVSAGTVVSDDVKVLTLID
jgi:hypothetical protein